VTPSVDHVVKKLSGGNIQKVLLGREIEQNPRLLITAYPVRGLDIGASCTIYDMLNEQKRRGVAILFIGEDLDVLRELSDRIMVLHGGEIMGIVDPATTTKEDIGLMMMGQKGTAPEGLK
jgi:simple sugar transport system ATP-binding protein